ncbi:GNAT family protein [Nonomuraea sp. MCN248]|uniref:GNAT family protein n=1 Tax=Nonomuraea corallina TaxID=2989783 RepID=A0ABT4SEY8_9ACTN|nr:GNAT family protein [Nonomuraea corallina]MDA0635767.1 GNAT family protein [Nonomuraea corallina]
MLFPHLKSATVRITPVRTGDGPRAYDLLLHAGVGAPPTLDAFLAQFGRGGKAQFIAETADGDPVAFVSLRDRDTAARRVHLDLHLDVAHAGTGAGAEIAMLGVNYAFAMWDLKKVCYEATSAEFDALGLTGEQAKLFCEEALLRDHVYQQGRFWDLHVHSVDRDTWERTGITLSSFPEQEKR